MGLARNDLFPYQVSALDRIVSSKRLIIGDEPGLGKTPMTLVAAAEYFQKNPALAKECVVICPASAVGVWRAMAAIWAPGINVGVFTYNKVTADEGLQRLLASKHLLILDECHYLGNPESKRTMEILGPAGIARNVPVVWALSGTPMQRHAGQLYPLLRGLWPDIIKIKYDKWLEAFCVTKMKKLPGQKPFRQIVKSKNLDKLKPVLANYMIRRTYKEVGNVLPDLIRIYHPVVDDTGRWRQCQRTHPEGGPLPTSPTKEIGLLKMGPAFEAIQDDLDSGAVKRPLIFAWHTDVLDYLCKKLTDNGFLVMRIDGNTPLAARPKIIAEFQRHGEADSSCILVCQIAAMETAATLTAADRVELVESSWNHARDDQAIARAHRTGQKKPLIARIHFLPNTIDGAIMERHMSQRSDRLALSI